MWPVPMRCNLRLTLAICSHISADTENAHTKREVCHHAALHTSTFPPSLMCACTHSYLLFSSCHERLVLLVPPFRSDAVSGWTRSCLSSPALPVATAGSAQHGAHGWRGGWVHVRTA